MEPRLDDAESVLAFLNLKARYGEVVDARFARVRRGAGELDDLARRGSELFTEDGVSDGGRPGRGPGAGGDRGPAGRATLVFSRHCP